MKKERELINSIRKNFIEITNRKISQKYIKEKIIPILNHINKSKKNMILISGPQGIGKTTILKIIEKNFTRFFNKRILTLSLDDFYLDKIKRKKISKKVHPLLLTRGVPGTHDIKEIEGVINRFKNEKYPIKIPVFDKLKDRRLAKKRIINKKCEIIIMEGWCCGSPPLNNDYLKKNINFLEKKYDKNFFWRQYYNNKLKTEYSRIFKKFDYIIFFKAPSFKNILKWRFKQENQMRRNSARINLGMNKNEINIFIQHYEKITKWMMKIMKKKSNLIISINKNQKIKKISSA